MLTVFKNFTKLQQVKTSSKKFYKKCKGCKGVTWDNEGPAKERKECDGWVGRD